MAKQPTILYVAAEFAPLVKVGGIADVVGSLPQALDNIGTPVAVILPYYETIKRSDNHQIVTDAIQITINGASEPVALYKTQHKNITLYFIDNSKYISNGEVYFTPGKNLTKKQEMARFLFFSKAVLACLDHLPEKSDILHLHDWHTACIAALLQNTDKPKTILTLHNVSYQGVWNSEWVASFLDIQTTKEWVTSGPDVNILQTGIVHADQVTTVSPTYAKEILKKSFSHGLYSVLKKHPKTIEGILNGIDTDQFNPETDTNITATFSTGTLDKKTVNKLALQQEVGFPQKKNTPLLGVVTRLVEQKGIDWIVDILPKLAKQDVHIVVLGTGDEKYEALLQQAEAAYPDNIRALIEFDVVKAQHIYAGCDMFIMPSRFEPCGLSQMISMRYGTIPIARATGGLKDTVRQYTHTSAGIQGTGFVFTKAKPKALYKSIAQAIKTYNKHPERWRQLQLNAMQEDFSWTSSAKKYQDLYLNLS